jgi:hypothetical protein
MLWTVVNPARSVCHAFAARASVVRSGGSPSSSVPVLRVERPREMDVRVDEAGQDRRAREVDHAGPGFGARPLGLDRRDPAVSDRDQDRTVDPGPATVEDVVGADRDRIGLPEDRGSPQGRTQEGCRDEPGAGKRSRSRDSRSPQNAFVS